MTVIYGIIEERYTVGGDTRVSYGIAAYADPAHCGSATVIASVHDITSDRERLSVLVQACNSQGLATTHLFTAVQDFLAE